MIRIEKSIQDIAYPSSGFRQVNLSDSPPPYNSRYPQIPGLNKGLWTLHAT